MKLIYSISKGCYNLLNLSEESISIFLGVKDEEKTVKTASFTLEYDEAEYEYWKDRFAEDPIDAFREAAQKWFDSILYASREEEVRDMLEFLDKHETELYITYYKEKIKKLEKKRATIDKEIEAIRNLIKTLKMGR